MIFFQRMEVMRLMRPAATEATLSYDLILILWWHAETLSCEAATIATRSLVGGPRFWFWVAGWLFSLAVAWVCSFLVFLYYRSNSSSIASLAAIRSNTESVVCCCNSNDRIGFNSGRIFYSSVCNKNLTIDGRLW